MGILALLTVAPVLVTHALGACTGMSTADTGTCPTDQCQSLETDFGSSSVLVAAAGAENSSAMFVSEQEPNHAFIDSNNLVLSLVKASNSGYEGSTVYFTKWIHYGTVTAVLRSGSTSPGIVSSFQLQSDDGSSIDMDWVGASSNRVQANFYTSNQIELSQAAAPILTTDPTASSIEYKIVWLPDSLTWYANGLAVRTVNRQNTWAEGEQRFNYPDQPARLSFSIWDASASTNPALTQKWAGVMRTDKSEFSMTIESVSVECYSNTTSHSSSPPSAKASADSEPRLSDLGPSGSTEKNDLSNFGLEPDNSVSKSESSDVTSISESGDDLSKWLAGINTSSAPRSLGNASIYCTLLAVLGLATFFPI
ncbi:concanavalin A-like lectin/glucanase [Coemansia reversa NRRL 1564]|uniref:Concanavalin A-like lectin/glucanase n=1 Tax=Coemansia reversa (strain ATCC 12441 / NRRL 1564) TaxID=763665 RepID=A0A2G5BF03_COERN|nr:concanavalin A-like lectin/glucanase [Coemansia reversa NRRL 1564]|eukprot:PIA17583.1 concanavalin A-like lectin/glucanase [Coemansia reversa NRRL 1564]